MTPKNDVGAQPLASNWTDPDDAPELTDEFFADAEHFVGNTFIRRGRGRPPTGNAKELISVRLDPDVLAKLREAGPGWQTQINTLLRQALTLDAVSPAQASASTSSRNPSRPAAMPEPE